MTEHRARPTMEFVGVTTGSSSIMRLFPLWARDLELDGATLVGRDLPLRAPAEAYRAAVEQIREDELSLGALVTTHKLALLESARDLFDELDPYAQRLGEVSSISKREGRVIGHAKDPITAGRALAAVLDPDHFARTGGHVLCLGAGGAGAAIVLHLLGRADRPGRIVVTDTHAERLAAVAALGDVETAGADAAAGLLAALPPGSLVVNATGLGKDRPGSPLPDGARFPADGVVWELNYRGSLDFLRQARAQAAERGLRVEDGWLYFLHGWSTVIAEVFAVEVTPERFERLRRTAEAIR
jgi:shikimate 5-dehydrogenase